MAPSSHDLQAPTRAERIAAVALLLEAAVLVAFSLGVAFGWVRDGATDVGGSGFLLAFGIVMAGGVAWVAKGMWQGARWARGPAFTWQVLQAALGVSVMQSDYWWALALLIPIVPVLVGVIAGSLRYGAAQAASRR